ncbi:CLUMA_CG002610, isoform B [Clunio marinus]|uniref:CLUMA_CG002610, isoform B n=1 Tax=Clunio marinus TaxID=568069 RepID=A0A1J1HNX8_9DIPT|nr:CLUMA_CG002610, isoform B [Clunio marinus]
MSFFHEPPPLDCDVPPPLDDKLRDNDFDLEDEEIIEDNRNLELPELPSDYNVFSSVGISYIHEPPDLPDLISPNQQSPSDSKIINQNNTNELSNSDVAKEKESFKPDVDVLQNTEKEIIDDDKKLNDEYLNPVVEKSMEVPPIISENFESNSDVSASVANIPIPNETKIEECSQNKGDLGENKQSKLTVNVIDDEFHDFVEAPPQSEHEVESVENFKAFTESQEIETEFDDFTSFTKNEEIAEPIPELNLDDDDDDDDFNDFESAIPVNRQIEQTQCFTTLNEKDEKPEEEVAFEADFSAFNAFSDKIDDVQGIKSENDSKISQLKHDGEDDDDDFGDFSDFTQAAISSSELEAHQPVSVVKPTNICGLLDMMFPFASYTQNETSEVLKNDSSNEQKLLKNDKYVTKFNDFDSTLALGHHYSNSKTSQSLVKALGIDTRNMLLGAQWASLSASSHMPRFAANLSFNPIEPIKPSTAQASSISVSIEPKSTPQPGKITAETVPEVEFDWNSSGLVNPLDEQLRVAMANSDKINSSSSLNHAPSSLVDPTNKLTDIDDVLRQFDSLNICQTTSASVVTNHSTIKRNSSQPKPQQSNESIINEQQSSSTHSVENESSIYGMDQEVTQVLETEAKVNAGHKSELNDVSSYQWSDFGGASATTTNNIVRTIKLPETHIFTPVKGTSPIAREVKSREASPDLDDSYYNKGSIVVKEYHDVEYSLKPSLKSESDDFDDFQSAQPNAIVSKPEPILLPMNILEPKKVVDNQTMEIKWPEPGNITQNVELDFLESSSAPPIQEASKSIIRTSPIQQQQNGNDDDDDDFNDFQAAPVKPQIEKNLSNDPITLSPARLVSQQQQSNQKAMWISSLDDVEISRIEAAFPKCKTEKKTISSHADADDDDWSEFVSVTQPNPSHPPATEQNHAKVKTNGDADDCNNNNYGYVNDKISKPSMTITNNFSYGFNQPEQFHNSSSSHHQQTTKPNAISTILPELDFAMPKHFNLSRGNNSGGAGSRSMDSGKK